MAQAGASVSSANSEVKLSTVNFAGIVAVRLVDGAADEVAAGAALVGAVVDELAGVRLDPGDEVGEGPRRARRVELGRVVGEQHLAAAVGHREVGVDGERVDLRIVREAGFLDVDEEPGVDRARGQARVVGLEVVGLRVGTAREGGERALGDGDGAGVVAGVDEVQRHVGIGRLEGRLDHVGPEVEDVLVRRRVPVDAAGLGMGKAGQQQHAGGGAAGGQQEGATLHSNPPFRCAGLSRLVRP